MEAAGLAPMTGQADDEAGPSALDLDGVTGAARQGSAWIENDAGGLAARFAPDGEMAVRGLGSGALLSPERVRLHQGEDVAAKRQGFAGRRLGTRGTGRDGLEPALHQPAAYRN